MGLHDRDYMKAGAGPRPRWSPHRLTWTIIIVNGVLWFLFSSSAARGGSDLFWFMSEQLMLWPTEVVGHFKIWQLFTAFWMHDPGSAGHVVFNMLALFFFGRAVETWLGPRRYLALYLGAGLFASLVYTLWSLAVGNAVPALGASGAVYAVLAWMACQQPRATVYLMMIVPMPMWLAVGVFIIGMQFLALGSAPLTAGGAVAHLSGAAFGAGFWFLFRRWHTTHGPGGWVVRMRRGRQKHRDPGAAHEELIRLRMDELLQKISAQGIESLSPEEKAFLEEVSRRYG